MYLEKILSISGESGLFKIISDTKGKNNIIVESILTNKRMPVFSTSNASTLKEVAIYTTNKEDEPLRNIFENIFEKHEGKTVLENKPTNQELKNLLEEVLPTYDKERVYVSDIKKIVNWYNILVNKGIITAEAIAEAKNEDANKDVKTSEENNKTED